MPTRKPRPTPANPGGRPKKAPEAKRRTRSVNMAQATSDHLDALAQAWGCTVSDVVERLVLAAQPGTPLPAPQLQAPAAGPRVKVVSSQDITPAKGLSARAYVDDPAIADQRSTT